MLGDHVFVCFRYLFYFFYFINTTYILSFDIISWLYKSEGQFSQSSGQSSTNKEFSILLIKVGSQQYMITYKLSALSRKKAHTKMVDPANWFIIRKPIKPQVLKGHFFLVQS
jgi:hypothetical protein